MRTDVKFSIEGTDYIIRSVPCEKFDYDDELYFNIGDSIKMAMIRDLMVEDKIPHDVDFRKVEDFEF